MLSDLKITVHFSTVKNTDLVEAVAAAEESGDLGGSCGSESAIIKSFVEVDDQRFDRCLQELDDSGINQIIDIPVLKRTTRFRIRTCNNCLVRSMTTLHVSGHLYENENNYTFVDENSKSVHCILEIPNQGKYFQLSFNVVHRNVSQKSDNLRTLLYSNLQQKAVGSTVKDVYSKCNSRMASPISYATVKDLLFQAEHLQNSYEKLNVLSYGFNFAYEFADCNELQQIKSVLASVIDEYPNDKDTINLLHPYGYHMSAYLQRRKELTNLLQDDNYLYKKVNRRIYYNLLLLNDLSIIPIHSNYKTIKYDELFLSIQSKLIRFLIGQIMTNDEHNELEMDQVCFEHVAKYSPPSFDDSEALKTYEQFTNLQIQDNQPFPTENLQQVVTSILLNNTLEMHVSNQALSFDHIYDHRSSSQPGKSRAQIMSSRETSKLAQIFTHFLSSSLRNRVISPKLYEFMILTFQKQVPSTNENFEKILNIFDDDLKPLITQVYTKNLSNISHSEISKIFAFLEDTKYRTGFNTTKKAALTLDLFVHSANYI